MAYWPWWAGGASLAVITVGSCVVARRPLGVSGIVARLVNLREELAAERVQARARAAGDAAFEAALLAATAEALGTDRTEGNLALDLEGGDRPGPSALPVLTEVHAEACSGECASPAARPTVVAHAVFLAAIVAGGFLARLARGGWAPALDLGPTFERVVGTGGRAAVALLLGGLLVGFGTTLSGGCSTGHGLSGCSRLQPAGVAATATFMAAGVAVSFLLAGRVFP